MWQIYFKYAIYLILVLGICYPAAQAQYDTLTTFFHKAYAIDTLEVFNGGAFETDEAYLLITNYNRNLRGLELRAIDKENGSLLWKKDLHQDRCTNYYDNLLLQTAPDTFMITMNDYTYGYRDIKMIWIDKKGNIAKEWKYGLQEVDEFIVVTQRTKDGGYILAGEFIGVADGGLYILKLDLNGNKEWEKKIIPEQPAYFADKILSICESSDGGYMLSGIHIKTIGESLLDFVNKMFVMKIDYFGNEVWTVYPKDDEEEDSGCFMSPFLTPTAVLPILIYLPHRELIAMAKYTLPK
ncbi:MAG: hypothetical protein IPL35_00450 [Sphingobacteriales bacterium]|nr:hypothetical protein [Sphingobacteriales bacterium]